MTGWFDFMLKNSIERFAGRIIRVTEDDVVLPNGCECHLEVVHHPGGAAAVAINSSREVCLLRQYRYVVNDWLWELPAGKRDHNEAPLETVARELAEEAGVRAGRIRDLGRIVSSPGVFSEEVFLYLAEDLEDAERAPEHGEVMEVHWIAFDDAVAKALAGGIQDAKTIIGLLRAKSVLGG